MARKKVESACVCECVCLNFERACVGTRTCIHSPAKGILSKNLIQSTSQYLRWIDSSKPLLLLPLLTHRPNLRAKYIISNKLLSVAYYMRTSNDSRPNRSFSHLFFTLLLLPLVFCFWYHSWASYSVHFVWVSWEIVWRTLYFRSLTLIVLF